MSAKHKVTIAREECTSCETCWITCPEFFEQNPNDGWSQIVEKYRVSGNAAEGISPVELEGKVREAADSCPVQIIHMG